MAAFWNGVDLRFREMKDPEIRLNIAGLVVNTVNKITTNSLKNFTLHLLLFFTKDSYAEPYLKRDSWDRNHFKNLEITAKKTSRFFLKKFPNFFDIVVALTR